MKLYTYVWRGKGVLPHYGTGLVVILADSEAAAWEKMKDQQFGVFCNLFYGAPSYFDTQWELDNWFKDKTDDNSPVSDPIEPEVFDLELTPVLHLRGGD